MFESKRIWPFLVVALGGAVCAAGQEERTYRVGVARVEITPGYPIRLNGFGGRREESQGVSQPIWAKALAIGEGDEPPLVLIAIDSLGVRTPLVDEVARRLQERFGVPRERVALTFTHSHCTPKVNGASDNIFSTPIPPEHQEHIDRYTRELTDKLEQVAAAAIDDRQPGSLAWGVGKVEFARNRRTPGGPIDHDLPLLVVKDDAGRPRAIYVSYACHCVTLSFNQISGDWAGYAQELIERKYPGAVALVSIGCGSDSNPASGVTGDKTDIAAQQGAEIADEVARLLAGELHSVTGPPAAQLNSIDLPLNDLPIRAQWEDLAAKGGPAGYNAQTQLAKLDRGESLPTAISYPVQSFTFGEQLQMMFLAGEVCVDYSHRLKRELDGKRLWLNGYSNDFCSYIPSERLVKEGGYGGGGEIPYFALPTTLKAGLEQQIVNEVKRQTPTGFHVAAGTQGVASKSPEESLRCLQTHDDLRIELVAAEPLVASPVAIDFGPDGRLWVAEMTDYARGVDEAFEQHGRVRYLTDSDDDGRYDRATEFLSGLRFPTDVKVWRDGVLICDAPEILFAADTDGDGRADVRKTLFTGFATHNPHARVNGLRRGLDGWLHGSGGLFGGEITNFNGQKVDLTNRDFRLHPETGEIEPVTGHTQQGRPRDDWDNWFGCTNGSLLIHNVVEDRYARRNPHVAPPTATQYVPADAAAEQLFPRGDLVLFKLSGAAGRPTSACGAEIYREHLLGDDYYGNSFTCEPVNQLVHRLTLRRQGATFTGRRAENEADSEFLTSTDQWFRPVQVRTGPDGALWIVDMYRYVIEHPRWIPPETIAGLNVFAGQDRGRIYRIVPKDGAPRRPAPLDRLAGADLAAAMDSSNGVQRDLVQQLTTERKSDGAVVGELQRVARESRFPAARVQALATLQGLHSITPELVLPLLADENPEVRRSGIRLCEPLLDQPGVLDALAKLGDDPEVFVRVQLACTLGESRSPQAVETLAKLAASAEGDAQLAGAILSSVRAENVLPLIQAVTARGGKPAEQLLESLWSVAGATADAAALAGVVERLTDGDANQIVAWTSLARLLDAADRREMTLGESLSTPAAERVRALFGSARETAQSQTAPEADRVAAMGLLGRATGRATASLPGAADATDASSLVRLAGASQPPAIQSAAVQAVARGAGTQAPELLLSCWAAATPRLRGEILDELLGRDAWSVALLDAIEKGRVKPNDLDATRRQRILSSKSDELRQRAEQLLATGANSNRKELVAQWQAATTLTGDHARGQEVFRKRCAACHKLDGIGNEVGPDLAALTNKSTVSLLVAILDPNRDVDGRYVSYLAELADGRTLSGLLTGESGASITLREQEGKEHVLLRADLEQLRSTGKSAMPEGLEKEMTPQDLADAIAFLLTPRTPPRQFPGNLPAIVTIGKDGALALLATQAEIFGAELAFESDSAFRNLGYWHGAGDLAGWQVQLEHPGRYDVYFDYACSPDSAGNWFRVDGAEPTLRGVVPSTGAWSEYRALRAGTIELPAGRSYITVRYDGEKKAPALFDLRGVHLVPPGVKPPFEP